MKTFLLQKKAWTEMNQYILFPLLKGKYDEKYIESLEKNALKFTKEEFNNIHVYITENGMAAADIESENGEVIDLSRVEYLRTHLEMVNNAVNEGCNIKGYFVWSLMNNYEWAYGYTKRFCISRVNYTTFERKLKMSGEYYSELIKQHKS